MRLILGAIFKNEAHILSEWIQHYLQRGVDHIYLINDHSTDAYEPIIQHFKDTTGRITLLDNDIETREAGRQILIYERFLRPFLPTADWIMVLDLDEFLYSPQGCQIKDVLAEMPPSIGQVKVDWLHFGSNGHQLQPASVVAGFTRRAAATSGNEWNSYKSIARTSAVECFGIHAQTVRGDSHHFVCADPETPPPLVINHYNLQSYEFYMTVKGTRGDVNNHFDSIGRSRNEALFRAYDRNEVEDLRLWRQHVRLCPRDTQ